MLNILQWVRPETARFTIEGEGSLPRGSAQFKEMLRDPAEYQLLWANCNCIKRADKGTR